MQNVIYKEGDEGLEVLYKKNWIGVIQPPEVPDSYGEVDEDCSMWTADMFFNEQSYVEYFDSLIEAKQFVEELIKDHILDSRVIKGSI